MASTRTLGIPELVSQVFQFLDSIHDDYEESSVEDTSSDSAMSSVSSTTSVRSTTSARLTTSTNSNGSFHTPVPFRIRTLARCALVSRLWYAEASRLLYNCVMLAFGPNVRTGYSRGFCLNPFQMIHPQRRQRIAGLIEDLTFIVGPECSGPASEATVGLHFNRLRMLGISVVLPPSRTAIPGSPEAEETGASQPAAVIATLQALLIAPNLYRLVLVGKGMTDFTTRFMGPLTTVLAPCVDRLRVLKLERVRWMSRQHLQLFEKCPQLEDLYLLDDDVDYPPDELHGLGATIDKALALPALLFLQIRSGQYLQPLHLPSPDEALHTPHVDRTHLRAIDLQGPVEACEEILARQKSFDIRRVDLNTRWTLRLLDWAIFCGPRFSNLRHLSVRLCSQLDYHSFFPDEYRDAVSWTIAPDTLLEIARNCPHLHYLAFGEPENPLLLRLDLDTNFFVQLAQLLPGLGHLEIQCNEEFCSWTAADFIEFGTRCRHLAHFDVSGELDITDPVFEQALDCSEYEGRIGREPLFPWLHMLRLTYQLLDPDRDDQSDSDQYRHASATGVASLQRLLDTHFPRLNLIRRTPPHYYNYGSSFDLERDSSTGTWPHKRLAYFMAPWYTRVNHNLVELIFGADSDTSLDEVDEND
jgi:hypothetical protein